MVCHSQAGIFILTLKLLHPLSICGCILTVCVFIRQPVVLVAVDFKAGVPSVALLLSRVAVDILTLIGIAHLELVSRPHARTAPVGWSEMDEGQWKNIWCVQF